MKIDGVAEVENGQITKVFGWVFFNIKIFLKSTFKTREADEKFSAE